MAQKYAIFKKEFRGNNKPKYYIFELIPVWYTFGILKRKSEKCLDLSQIRDGYVGISPQNPNYSDSWTRDEEVIKDKYNQLLDYLGKDQGFVKIDASELCRKSINEIETYYNEGRI